MIEATENVVTHKKRTRAEVLRDRVVVRLALDEAGPLIAEVLKENGIELPGADWNRVFPNWLIACDGDKIIGCVQVMPAKPVGYLNFLYAKPSANFKLRAIAIRKLAVAGMSTMHYAGARYIAGFVSPESRKFIKVLEKVGFGKLSDGLVMIKYIPGEGEVFTPKDKL